MASKHAQVLFLKSKLMAANKKRQRVFVCIFVGLNKTDRSEVQRTVFLRMVMGKEASSEVPSAQSSQPRSAKTLGRYKYKGCPTNRPLVSLVGGCWILMV